MEVPAFRRRLLDFLWLQMIKLKEPDLYDWVEEYLGNVAAYRDGGRPSDGDEERLAKVLFSLMERAGWHNRPYLSGIGSATGVDVLCARR